MTEIIWEDPPLRGETSGRNDWESFANELRRHPGKWAIARTGGSAASSFGSTGAALKARGCEATQRKQSDGTYTLYARWPAEAS